MHYTITGQARLNKHFSNITLLGVSKNLINTVNKQPTKTIILTWYH